MHDVLVLIVQAAATMFVSARIVRYDMKRLAPQLLARAWPDSSLWSAVVCFSPLCVPVHFLRTRRSLPGAGLALAWFFATILVTNGLAWAEEGALGGGDERGESAPNRAGEPGLE